MLLRFITAFTNGVSGVTMPIAGVLREERDNTSLGQLARISFAYSNAVIAAAVILMLIFREYLAAMFGMDGDILYFALACFCAYIPFYMNGSLLIAWYAGIRRAAQANIITLAQDMLFLPMFAALLAAAEIRYIWLHLPAAGITAALLLPFLMLWSRRRAPELSAPLLLDTRITGQTLSFSVECDAAKASEASASVSAFCEENNLEKRRTMLISMAIEELISLIANHGSAGKREEISVRVSFFDGGTVMRLRSSGRKFNPVAYYENCLLRVKNIDTEESLDFIGLKYIVEAAEAVYYRETFGVNNLVILI
jgi:anti-sigma regulatory factor (Ser/Thr protein kinase)